MPVAQAPNLGIHLDFALSLRFSQQPYNWSFYIGSVPPWLTGNTATREIFQKVSQGFPGGAVVENLPANAGDTGSRPGLGRSHMPQSN